MTTNIIRIPTLKGIEVVFIPTDVPSTNCTCSNGRYVHTGTFIEHFIPEWIPDMNCPVHARILKALNCQER